MNHVVLKGNVSRQPELKFTSSGQAICDFGLAVNERYMKDGQWQDKPPLFIDVAQFGTAAERTNANISKGSLVYVIGKLKLDQWTSQDGQKRSKISLIANSVDAVQKAERRETTNQEADDGRDDSPF